MPVTELAATVGKDEYEALWVWWLSVLEPERKRNASAWKAWEQWALSQLGAPMKRGGIVRWVDLCAALEHAGRATQQTQDHEQIRAPMRYALASAENALMDAVEWRQAREQARQRGVKFLRAWGDA